LVLFFQTRESVFQKMDLFFLRNLFSEKKEIQILFSFFYSFQIRF